MSHIVPPGAGGTPHTPYGLFPDFVQTLPQHSAFCWQMSPFCVQKETCERQMPPLQIFEQHSPFCAHALPDVLQLPLSGVHVFGPPSAPAHT